MKEKRKEEEKRAGSQFTFLAASLDADTAATNMGLMADQTETRKSW